MKLGLPTLEQISAGLIQISQRLSSYFQPSPPPSPPCFELKQIRVNEDSNPANQDSNNENSNNKNDGERICPLIGQCPRHLDANQLADAQVILTTVAAAIFTRPLPHVSPQ